MALPGAIRRDDDTIVLHLIKDGQVRPATPWRHAAIPPDAPEADDIHGVALGRTNGETYAIANFRSGHIAQWRIHEAPGTLALEQARTLRVASQPEGMVADDPAGHLHVGEDVGIWRFPLAPEGVRVAAIPSSCLPRDDVEGLAVYDRVEGRWLVASAQGVHRTALFRLDGEAAPLCEALVEIVPDAVDGVTETDGLDVTALPSAWTCPRAFLS